MRIDLEGLIKRMLAKGIPPTTIASLVQIDEDEIRAIDYEREVLEGTPDTLGKAMQDLAWRAYWQAREMLEYGSPPVRIALIRAIYSRTSAYLKDAVPAGEEELRNEFLGLIQQSVIHDTNDGTDFSASLPTYGPQAVD